MLRTIALLALITCVVAQNRAIVQLEGRGNGVSGSITFSENNGAVLVEGQITGLEEGLHGFHIHQLGDLSGGCATTGGHFNPEKKNHGAPNATVRHVGDLGNIRADHTGTAHINIHDKLIALHGNHNILGRAVVVHSGEDDFGLGGHNDSLTTGHAGGRVACGIIGILSNEWSSGAISTLSISIPLMTTLALLLKSL